MKKILIAFSERDTDMSKVIGAWVIVYCRTTSKFLLGQRSDISSNPLTWNFFGGKAEKSRTTL